MEIITYTENTELSIRIFKILIYLRVTEQDDHPVMHDVPIVVSRGMCI